MPISPRERFSKAWNLLVRMSDELWSHEESSRTYLNRYKELRRRTTSALGEASFVNRIQKEWYRRYKQKRGTTPAEIYLMEIEAVGGAAQDVLAQSAAKKGDVSFDEVGSVLNAISVAYGSASDLLDNPPWWVKTTLVGGKEVADIFKRT